MPPGDPGPATDSAVARVRAFLLGVPSEPRELPRTEVGESTFQDLGGRLVQMLNRAALLRAHRRRATAQDRTDLEAAFDDMVHPATRPVWVDALCDAFLATASLFVGVGTNIATGSGPDASAGWKIVAPSFALGLFAILIRYVKPRS